MTEFKDCFWGPNGFDELKKYMKLGNDFCRELASILVERFESELAYSKSLNKTSLRLQKLTKDFHGGLADAWLKVSMQFDAESEMHKAFGTAIQEEIVKPLKILAENQSKFRKPIESRVEKSIKHYNDKKTEDYKYRSRCFQTIKDIEKSMYGLDEAQKGLGGKPPNQKEIHRLENQIAKSKEYLEKSEAKYHKACGAVELARQDWQIEIVRGCNQIQTIETDRINQLDQLVKKLALQFNLLSSKMIKVVDVFQSIRIDASHDIQLACRKYGTGPNDQELLLYDIYAENTKNMMNRDRRLVNLKKWSEMLSTDLQGQVKSRQGLDKVKTFAKENPSFGGNNDADIRIKFESVRLLHLMYEASLFKVKSALAELSEDSKVAFSHANHITTTYDKQGVPLSILKLASENHFDSHKASAPSPPPHSPPYPISNRGMLSNSSSTHSFASSSCYTPVAIVPPPTITHISMPMPYSSSSSSYSNPYNDSSSSRPDVNTGAHCGGSSASSMSASSVSPASSSTQHSQSSPSSMTMPQPNRTSSYLLTTTNHHDHSNEHPPSYNTATVKHEDDDDEWNETTSSQTILGKCIVQYDYKSVRDDELTLKTGDEIDIVEKRTDGWWRGHLQHAIGLFPSTYVKEFEIEHI